MLCRPSGSCIACLDQQLRVVATLSDGTTKDVTAEAEYRSQQPDLVTVDTDGRATTQDAVGEGTVMVRYRGMVDIARLTVPFGRQVPADAYAHFQPKGYVDNLVLAKWQKLGIAPSERATDAEFVRRAYLDCHRHVADARGSPGLSGRSKTPTGAVTWSISCWRETSTPVSGRANGATCCETSGGARRPSEAPMPLPPGFATPSSKTCPTTSSCGPF